MDEYSIATKTKKFLKKYNPEKTSEKMNVMLTAVR